MNKMHEDVGVFFSLQKIKDKYTKNHQYKKVIQRKAETPAEMDEKIRQLSVLLQMLASENQQLIGWSQTYEDVLRDKNSQLELKDKQIKKYQAQVLDAMKKNEDLANYSRKLANQYNSLMNSIKDNKEADNYKLMISEGKLHAAEGQLTYLRNDILAKARKEEIYRKQNKKKRSDSSKKKEKKEREDSRVSKKSKNLLQISNI